MKWTTYASQCVLEIFTFLRMGGAVERVEVQLITDPGKDPVEARAELIATLARFDAVKVSGHIEYGTVWHGMTLCTSLHSPEGSQC